MRHSVSPVRVLSLALLATATVAATSGCSWFHKGARGDYALARKPVRWKCRRI